MIKKYEIGSSCRTYGVEDWCMLAFGEETEGKETTSETQVQMRG